LNAIVAIRLQRGRSASGPSDVRELAAQLREAGATWAYVRDEDAAAGGAHQWSVASRLMDAGLSVAWGGGVRSLMQVQQLLDLGVRIVGLGTQALAHPLWFQEACKVFGARVGLDLTGAEDPARHGAALAGAGQGFTLVRGDMPQEAVPAGAPVWALLAQPGDAQRWEGVAQAVLVEPPHALEPGWFQRHLPPAPVQRRRALAAAWRAGGGDSSEE